MERMDSGVVGVLRWLFSNRNNHEIVIFNNNDCSFSAFHFSIGFDGRLRKNWPYYPSFSDPNICLAQLQIHRLQGSMPLVFWSDLSCGRWEKINAAAGQQCETMEGLDLN